MKYKALRRLTYSKGGQGYTDENKNWHGDTVEAGEEFDVRHLNASQLQMLVNDGALAEMPDIKIEKPATDKPAAAVKSTKDDKAAD